MTKIKNWFKNPFFLLCFAILLYLAVFFCLCLYKYQHFLYDLEDLSIFNNVVWNTAHGKLFWFSVHGGFSYLGDHLELGLLLLLPIYYFFQSPLTLLFLQTALFALSAWPVYLIAEYFLVQQDATFLSPPYEELAPSSSRGGARGGYEPLFIAIIYLLNPFIQNINLEEFHVAPLLLFFFLWTFYFYLKKQYRPFLLFFVLTLLIREEAALTLGALAAIAAWDNRRHLWMARKWWLYPLLLAGGWFFCAQWLISFFNPDNGFRYLLLYQNMLLSSPFQIPFHLFNPKNFWLIISYLLPFLFLPLYRPKYLILAIPTFLQIFLMDGGGSNVAFSTHYQTFILVALFLALIESLAALNQKRPLAKYLPLIIFLLVFSQLYVGFFLGPLKTFDWTEKKNTIHLIDEKENHQIISLIPPEASLSGPYRLMPDLSNREKSYVNKLMFLGKKHLSTSDFFLPSDTEYLLIDSQDMIEYYLHFQNRASYSQLYWGGAERTRQTISSQNFQPVAMTEGLILLKKDGPSADLPYQIFDQPPTGEGVPMLRRDAPTILSGQKTDFGNIEFLGWKKSLNSLTLWWQVKEKITDDYFLEFSFYDQNQKLLAQKIYPPAYGLLPTHDWPAGQFVHLIQILPADLPTDNLQISLIKIKGDIELGALNDTLLIVDEKFDIPSHCRTEVIMSYLREVKMSYLR